MKPAAAPWQKARRSLRRRLGRLSFALGCGGLREAPRLDLLFGTRSIARYMGLSRRQARSLVASRAIPCFELAGVTCARRSSIERHLQALEQRVHRP